MRRWPMLLPQRYIVRADLRSTTCCPLSGNEVVRIAAGGGVLVPYLRLRELAPCTNLRG